MKPSTFTTCDRAEAAAFPILFIPFHGKKIAVKIRQLTHAQLRACGEFSLIPDFHNKLNAKRLKMRDLVQYAEIQHNIVKAALVMPTYDQLIDHLGKTPGLQDRKKELNELKKKLEYAPRGHQRAVLEEEIESMRIWIDLILPDDFIGFIVAEETGVNKSEIQKLTEDMLLDAAILAEKGYKRPSEIIAVDGFWTPFMLADIDKRAWMVLAEFKDRYYNSQKKPRMKIGGR